MSMLMGALEMSIVRLEEDKAMVTYADEFSSRKCV